MFKKKNVLGIETSCDDTAVGIINLILDKKKIKETKILSSEVINQNSLHNEFGGIVPEIAARAHLNNINNCISNALRDAKLKLKNIDIISVTSGPGLIGGLITGVSYAKGLSYYTKKKLVGVNHLAGHVLSPKLTSKINFPYLVLLISGGHSQFIIVKNSNTFEKIGGTLDDAPGEVFDKIAKVMGLKFPGGPEIEKLAKKGNPTEYLFPEPLSKSNDCNMSFSGLKTSVRKKYENILDVNKKSSHKVKKDICASFQKTITNILEIKTKSAMEIFEKKFQNNEKNIAIVGGVASNNEIRLALKKICHEKKFNFYVPPPEFCTDNGVMIAYAGAEKFFSGEVNAKDLTPRARWPLDIFSSPLIGSGKKGVKG